MFGPGIATVLPARVTLKPQQPATRPRHDDPASGTAHLARNQYLRAVAPRAELTVPTLTGLCEIPSRGDLAGLRSGT